MLEYVHHELIPKLMLKREASGLFDGIGDNDSNEVGITADKLVAPQPPTNKGPLLQLYGLSTISMIATMARWMHAGGFRYKKESSIILSMVTNNRKR